MKKTRVSKTNTSEDFDIDLEALAGVVGGKEEEEEKEEQPAPPQQKAKKPTKPTKPSKSSKPKSESPKPKPKPKSPKPKPESPKSKRGHPIKGTLKPIAKRVYRSEKSIFETLQNPKEGSAYGLILGHISKKWTLKDAANAIKVLVAKKKLPEAYGQLPSAFNAAQWVARETLRRGIIKVAKDGTKEASE
jgi:outer membrane biosynthesis protein TonB